MAAKLSVLAPGAFQSLKGPHSASSPLLLKMSNDLEAVMRSCRVRGAAFLLSSGRELGLGLGADALSADSPQLSTTARSSEHESNTRSINSSDLGFLDEQSSGDNVIDSRIMRKNKRQAVVECNEKFNQFNMVIPVFEWFCGY
jgi:hypothetical protein